MTSLIQRQKTALKIVMWAELNSKPKGEWVTGPASASQSVSNDPRLAGQLNSLRKHCEAVEALAT